ncbi:MAG: hypothetical protein IKL53_06260 [Lachnospiraceae bacterium]|nr:hypothetical protein [Lachnospiraceae bacterium]
MSNVFTRRVDVSRLKDVPLSDYTAGELVVYISKNFPNDQFGALNNLIENQEIGLILGRQTKLLLEGLTNVKRDMLCEKISQ